MNNETQAYRKSLIPMWIKIFSWIFMILGFLGAPFVIIYQLITKQPMEFTVFGLEHYGLFYEPMGLLIMLLLILLGISSYGLLFGKKWGVTMALPVGYIGIAIVIFVMAYAIIFNNSIVIRFELIAQIPFILKMHKIRTSWMQAE